MKGGEEDERIKRSLVEDGGMQQSFSIGSFVAAIYRQLLLYLLAPCTGITGCHEDG